MLRRWHALAAVFALGCAEPYVHPDEPVVRKYGGDLVAGQYVSPTAYEQYILAMLAENGGRFEEAVEALRRALGSDGTSAYLRWKLADALLSTGRVDEARDELSTALQLEPDAAEAYVVEARLRARLGDRAGLEAAAQRAIELDPKLEEAYLVLATAFHDEGDEARSLTTMRALAAHVPSATAEEALGRAALGVRDRKGAREHLQRAIDLDGSRIEVRIELARVLLGDGDTDPGLGLLTAAAERTRDPAVYLELARAASAHGRRARALVVLDRLEEDAHTSQARLDVGLAFVAVGAPQRAISIARTLLADDKHMRAVTHALIGRAAEEDGAIADALVAWQEITALDALYTDAILTRARLLQQRGRHAEALALYEQSITDRTTRNRLDERDQLAVARASLRAMLGDKAQATAQLAALSVSRPRSLVLKLGLARLSPPEAAVSILEPLAEDELRAQLLLARVRVQLGSHLEAACKQLERAEGAAPHDADVAVTLGSVYLAQHRLDDAQRLLERADRLRPNDLEALTQLGALYAQRNDRPRALAAVTRALAAHPTDPQREALEEQRVQLTSKMGSR